MSDIYANEIVEEINEIADVLEGKTVVEDKGTFTNPVSKALNRIKNSIAEGGSSLPEITSGDEGKVLTVDDNLSPTWQTVSDGSLPEITSGDEGEVLGLKKNFSTQAVMTVLSEQSVTTDDGYGELVVSQGFAFDDMPDFLDVVFDGTEYTLPIATYERGLYALYGEFDSEDTPLFTTFPLALYIEALYPELMVDPENDGTFAISATGKFHPLINAWFDRGYSYNQSLKVVYEDRVTTELVNDENTAILQNENAFVADVLYVTFEGEEYTCPYNRNVDGYGAGWNHVDGYDWSEYPFFFSSSDFTSLITENAGTFSISISTPSPTIVLSDEFINAIPPVLPELTESDNGKILLGYASDSTDTPSWILSRGYTKSIFTSIDENQNIASIDASELGQNIYGSGGVPVIICVLALTTTPYYTVYRYCGPYSSTNDRYSMSGFIFQTAPQQFAPQFILVDRRTGAITTYTP